LQHYDLDVVRHSDFQNLSSLSKLYQQLAESRKSHKYFLIDNLIRLILTLPVSTATTERACSSAIKLVKTSLRNKIEEFFADCTIIYIKRDIAETVGLDSVIEKFYTLKHRRYHSNRISKR